MRLEGIFTNLLGLSLYYFKHFFVFEYQTFIFVRHMKVGIIFDALRILTLY